MDNDVIVYAVFTSIKLGLKNSTCFLANKKEGLDAGSILYQFFNSKLPALAGFGAPSLLSTIVLTVVFESLSQNTLTKRQTRLTWKIQWTPTILTHAINIELAI